ncbi:Pycsar system effector family protein [Croceiramulus getboli]|nr:DUF5706 domain-containing protein [Flavobacteriaceae bacterium YJPT1-3]
MKNQNQLKKERPALQEPRDDHTADMVDHYWFSINYVTSLIKASEIKAGLILSFYGILLNFLYQSTINILISASERSLLLLLAGLWLLCTATSIFFCVRCFIPKIEGNYDRNMFFFSDVISKFGSVKDFSKKFYKVSLDEDELFLQLGEQIFIISKIAAWKFKNVKRAIWFLALGLFLLFGTITYYLISEGIFSRML